MNIERAKKLSAAGLRHVTGLPVLGGGEFQANHEWLGKFFFSIGNGGHYTLVTDDGEVWIGTFHGDERVFRKYAQDHTMVFLCPYAGSHIKEDWYLRKKARSLKSQRYAKPYSSCRGKYSPIPQIRR